MDIHYRIALNCERYLELPEDVKEWVIIRHRQQREEREIVVGGECMYCPISQRECDKDCVFLVKEWIEDNVRKGTGQEQDNFCGLRKLMADALAHNEQRRKIKGF